tara:strand:+ start:1520 stop:2398 length:879 start_codon:yes stop_codon:yes gene_type:complete
MPISKIPFNALQSGTVQSSNLADGAVTSAKIGDGQVLTAKLENEGVTSAKILNGTVAATDLADAAVTDTKLSAAAKKSANIDSIALSTAADDGDNLILDGTDVSQTNAGDKINLDGVDSPIVTSQSGQILERISCVPQGQQINGHQFENVTVAQTFTTSFQNMTGSNITYKPPEGTKRVEYNFNFKHEVGAGSAIGSYKLFVDDVEVLYARTDISATSFNARVEYKWIFECAAATNDTNFGAFTSWTTPKNIHMEGREYNSSHQVVLHQTNYWEASGANHFSAPVLTITAYS